MWGPLRSEIFATGEDRSQVWTRYVVSALLVFALPLPLFLFLNSYTGDFSVSFFLTGTGVELGLCLFVYFLWRQDVITRRKFCTLDYLIRTVVGLPFTVYVFIFLPDGALGLLRFAAGCLLLLALQRLSVYAWHVVFFSLGLLAFSLLFGFSGSQEGRILLGLCAVLLAGLLGAREWLYRWQELERLRVMRGGRRRSLRLKDR